MVVLHHIACTTSYDKMGISCLFLRATPWRWSRWEL